MLHENVNIGKETLLLPPSNVRTSAPRRRVPPGVWGLLLLAPALYLLIAGGKAWLESTQNKTLTVVSYAEFVKRMPKSGWYTITGGMVDVRKSVYWDENGVCVGVFAPLQPADGSSRNSADIYVEIDSPATLSVFQDMTYARKRGGDAGAQSFMAQHMDIFVQRRDVSGLVSYGHRDPIGEWARAGLDAATITFLEDGWKPNLLFGYIGTATGAVLTALALRLLAKSFQRGRN